MFDTNNKIKYKNLTIRHLFYHTMYHTISVFSFRKSVQDYIVHMDMEIIIFVGIKG